jgi:hypothetical protein
MPQIKPYTAQVGVQGGFSTVQISPDVESSQGKGLMQLGQGLSDVGQAVKSIDDTVQTSDAAAKMAELRVQQTNKIKEASMNGDVDPEKLFEEYNNEFGKLQDQFSSAAARGYLSRVNNELKSTIATSTFSAQAELTRVKVLDSKQKQMSSWSAVLATDPTQRASILKEYEEYNSQMPLSAQMKEKMRYEDMKNLDVAEFRGRISLLGGQGDLDKAVSSLNALKASLEGGAFNKDRNFDDETILSLSGAIDREITGRISENNRIKQLTEDAKKQKEEALISSFLEDSVSGKNKYSRLDIIKSGIDPSKAISTINFLDSYGKRLDKTNSSSIKNEAYQKMLLPDGDPNKIVSIEQLNLYTQKVDADTASWLTGKFMSAKTPQEKVNASLKSTYYNAAKKQLGIDPLSKIVDPKSEEILASLINEFESEYAKKVSEGVTPSELLTREGKNSLYPMIDRYKRGLNERIADLTSGMKTNKKGLPPVKADGSKMSPQEYLDSLKKEKKGN